MPAVELTRRPRVLFALDVGLAVMFVAPLLVAEAKMGTHAGSAATTIRITAICVASACVAVRRLQPAAAFTVATLCATAATSLGGAPQLSVCVAFVAYTAACTWEPRWQWPPVLSAAALATGVVVGRVDGWFAALFACAAVVCVGWFAGQATRERRSRELATAERQAERARQHAAELRQAAIDERLVIARELHDIVAHAMSVIAVRAGVARMVMDQDPEEVREALGIVETTTRQALQEMRLLVAVLRDEDAFDAALAPAPGMTDLEALTEQIRRAGVSVHLDRRGEQRPLPPGVDLSAYRIAQEALTNVVRHAGPTEATLRVEYLADELLIEVRDAGPAADSARATPVEPGASARAGHGLIGMGERVALFGGELHAGRRGSGFEVRALLPTADRPV